jgi:hypothetical protein
LLLYRRRDDIVAYLPETHHPSARIVPLNAFSKRRRRLGVALCITPGAAKRNIARALLVGGAAPLGGICGDNGVTTRCAIAEEEG